MQISINELLKRGEENRADIFDDSEETIKEAGKIVAEKKKEGADTKKEKKEHKPNAVADTVGRELLERLEELHAVKNDDDLEALLNEVLIGVNDRTWRTVLYRMHQQDSFEARYKLLYDFVMAAEGLRVIR